MAGTSKSSQGSIESCMMSVWSSLVPSPSEEATFSPSGLGRRNQLPPSGTVGQWDAGAKRSGSSGPSTEFANSHAVIAILSRACRCRPRPLIARPGREESRRGPNHADRGRVIRSRASSSRRPPRFGRRPRPAVTRPGRAAKRPGEVSTPAGRIRRRPRAHRPLSVPIIRRPREVFPRTGGVIPVTIPADIGTLRPRRGHRMTSSSPRIASGARRPTACFKLSTPTDRLPVGSCPMRREIGRGRTVR